MAIEVVGRDVDQQADARRKRRRKVDLIGRALDDMDAARDGRRQIENRHANVAAHRYVAPRLLQHMGDQRGGGRFAVGAGDGDERRVGRSRVTLAHEELDVADDRNPGLIREVDRPMRLGMSERHAGREHEHLEAAPVGLREIDQRNTRGGSALTGRGAVVPATTSAPPATSARAVESPEPPRPNRATLWPQRVSTGIIVT